MRISADEGLVADAIQEVFLRLLQRLATLDEIDNLRTYLFVALKNRLVKEALSQQRHRRHQARYALNMQAFDEMELPGDGERERKLRLCLRAIDKLPAGLRDILLMRYLGGYDYREIATVTQRNYQVTRNYASRALKDVRREAKRQLLN